MRAMISTPDRHPSRFQVHISSVQGGEAGGIGQRRSVQEGGKDSLETGGGGCGFPGVDVAFGVRSLGLMLLQRKRFRVWEVREDLGGRPYVEFCGWL